MHFCTVIPNLFRDPFLYVYILMTLYISGFNMSLKPQWLFNQSGVIPFRREEGKIRIMLITSRRRKRWVIPKGVIEPHLSPQESAVNEAHEEAGIKGHISPETVGEYRYHKWGGVCTVRVFLFEVEEIAEDWPEAHMRKRKWMSVQEAEKLVDEQFLKEMIRKVPELISQKQ